MRKILVKFPKPDVVEFEFGEQDTVVKVNSYINLADEKVIISAYLDVYFNPDEEHRFDGLDTHFYGAELVFDMAVIDIATNIKIESDKIKIDDIYSSGLMAMVRGKIKNLPQIRKKLERIVSDARQERFSVNGLLKEFSSLVEGFDFDKIKELAKEVKELESDIEDSPIAGLMDEGKQ